MNRSTLLAALWLLFVLAALAAVAFWWQLALEPTIRMDRVLHLEPQARPSVVGLVRVSVPLAGGTRRAWRLPAGRPGLRYELTVPGDGAVLRFVEATMQGLPDVAVRLTRADGSREEVDVTPATQGAWTLRRVPLPVSAGEPVELEILALDGEGRPGLGEALVGDVTLLSGGRSVDERAVAVPVESVAADLMAGTTVEQRRLPESRASARVSAPGPHGLPLQPLVGRELRVDLVPPDARLALVLYAARTSDGPLVPTHVTVRLNDEERARVRVDEAADPIGDAEPFHQLLVELDLGPHAGRPLSLRLELTGGENLSVGVVECVVIQRSTNPPTEHDPEKGVNLLLLAVEGLRADRLSPWGYTRGHTPHLDALARRGLVYQRVLAPNAWALPNLATLFTGETPLAHGVGMADAAVLDPRITTLARAAGWAGRMSAAFSSSTMPLEQAGLTRGYGHFESSPEAAPVLAERAIDWLADAGQFSWFLTLVLSDPTWPHEPEPEDLYALDPVPDPELLARLRTLDSRPGAAEGVAHEIGAAYDAELARVDRALGMVLDELEQRGLAERTVVAVVGVHGQEFYERGGRSQGHTLYDELVHLPLILAGPGVARPEDAPVLVTQPVALADVTHLLGHVGRILSTGSVSDRVPPPFGPNRPHSAHHAVLRPVSGVTDVALEATRRDELLLIHDPTTGERRLYDMLADPDALHDLTQPGSLTERLAAQVEALSAAFETWYEQELTDPPAQARRWIEP